MERVLVSSQIDKQLVALESSDSGKNLLAVPRDANRRKSSNLKKRSASEAGVGNRNHSTDETNMISESSAYNSRRFQDDSENSTNYE